MAKKTISQQCATFFKKYGLPEGLEYTEATDEWLIYADCDWYVALEKQATAIIEKYLWEIIQKNCEIVSRTYSPCPDTYSVLRNGEFKDGPDELALLLEAAEAVTK